MFCGDTAQNTIGERGVALVHSFGYGLFSDTSSMQALIFNGKVTGRSRPKSHFNGSSNKTTHALCSHAMIEFSNEVYSLPVYAPSNTNAINYQEIVSHGRTFINHAHATYGESNAFIPVDYWEL